jgi:hypothetical protein
MPNLGKNPRLFITSYSRDPATTVPSTPPQMKQIAMAGRGTSQSGSLS